MRDYEAVYTADDFYDGPRSGVADFGGVPHAYESEYADFPEDYVDTFLLSPVSAETLELALEASAIFWRWRAAFDEGRVALATHPALPEDRARYEELREVLRQATTIDPGTAIRAMGEFRPRDTHARPTEGDCPWVVRWVVVENPLTELDRIILRTLRDFLDAITMDGWSGRREGEAIWLYAMAHLQHAAKPGTILFDPLQIAVDFPVRQIAPEKQKAISKRRRRPKREVAKDMMIWPQPEMTTWTAEGESGLVPLAILEWKFDRVSPHEDDVRWLEEYTIEHPECVGYAVSMKRREPAAFSVNVTRVERGARAVDWFVYAGWPAP